MLEGALSLEILSTIFGLLFLFVLLLIVDYSLGRKNHLKNLKRKNYPFRQSDIELFTKGPELFADLFTELRRAKKHIHILFYIVKDDQISTEFLSILKRKGKRRSRSTPSA